MYFHPHVSSRTQQTLATFGNIPHNIDIRIACEVSIIMQEFWHSFAAALTNRRGITATEYAVVALGVILVVASAASLLGGAVSQTFSKAIATL